MSGKERFAVKEEKRNLFLERNFLLHLVYDVSFLPLRRFSFGVLSFL